MEIKLKNKTITNRYLALSYSRVVLDNGSESYKSKLYRT